MIEDVMEEGPYCTFVGMRLKRAFGHCNPFYSPAQLFFLFLFFGGANNLVSRFIHCAFRKT